MNNKNNETVDDILRKKYDLDYLILNTIDKNEKYDLLYMQNKIVKFNRLTSYYQNIVLVDRQVFERELNQILKDTQVSLRDLFIFYLFRIKELNYLLKNSIDENQRKELLYDLETYEYRLSNLKKKISEEKLEKLFDTMYQYKRDYDEHLLEVSSDIIEDSTRDLYEEHIREQER